MNIDSSTRERPPPEQAGLTRLQLRLLFKVNQFHDWTEVDQGELAAEMGVRRQAICTALNVLVRAGYIEKRSQAETREVRCQYRAASGNPAAGPRRG